MLSDHEPKSKETVVNSQSNMDSDNRSSFDLGQLLLGKYRIEQVIGQGGMGLVLGAIHVELQHRVAIKVLLPNGPGGEKFETRFLREAQAAASLRSENVVRVYDVGRLEDDRPYMVMEWLEGHDLSSGPMGVALPSEQAVDYLVQACDAMAAAHGRNLVHRDLKPANLFLVHDEHGVPILKVLDFGISKLRRDDEANLALTEANGLIGSPLYMSPEQVRSARDVDARADIWSLGTILYELLTGEPPFKGETLGAVFVAVAHDTPTPLTQLRPDLPKELEQVVSCCLSKDPAARYQTAQDLQRALMPFASARSQAKISMRSSSLPSVLPPSMPRTVVATSPVARTTGGWSEAAQRSRPSRQRALALAATLLVLVVAVVGGWTIIRRPATSRDVTEPGASAASTVAGINSIAAASPSQGSPSSAHAAAVAPVVIAVPTTSAAPSVASQATARRKVPSGATPSPLASAPPPTAVSTAASPAAPKLSPSNTKKNPLDIQFK